ncbi:MAG: hypothetical protein AB7S77_06225 [Desulfatirhabdiaceae bacterium]
MKTAGFILNFGGSLDGMDGGAQDWQRCDNEKKFQTVTTQVSQKSEFRKARM